MTSSDAVKVLVMYASQTGNAEHVAKNIEAQVLILQQFIPNYPFINLLIYPTID
jgi:sulfite reductase alpha subunit-like flavoprotein